MKKAENATLKVEVNSHVQLSDFEKAQQAIIAVGFKIKKHATMQGHIAKLNQMEILEQAENYQGITIRDEERREFTIKEPVVLRELIAFVLERCRIQSVELEKEIVESSKVISQGKAA